MYYMLLYIHITLANKFLTFAFVATNLCEVLFTPRRRRRLRSAGARSSGASYLRDLLLWHGDQDARRYIENIQSQVNRKNNGMMAARRAVARRVGAMVVDGRKMRAAADDRGQHCKLEKLVTPKKLNPKSSNPHHVRDRCICSYHVRYRTVHCKIQYIILPIINTGDPTIMRFKDQ